MRFRLLFPYLRIWYTVLYAYVHDYNYVEMMIFVTKIGLLPACTIIYSS